METPKWQFFERIEKMEPKLEKLEPKVDDIGKLTTVMFRLLFMSLVVENRGMSARRIKDTVVRMLKYEGISRDVLDEMEDYMEGICIVDEKDKEI